MTATDEIMAVFDSTPAMICALDEEQSILFANRAMRNFLGMSIEDLRLGRACGVFGCIRAQEHPRGCGYGESCTTCEVNNAIRNTLQTGVPFQDIEFRTTLVSGEGHRDVVLLAATARLTADNRSRVLLTLSDISDRHRMEQNLRETQERFQTLFHTSPNPLILTRMKDGEIIEINEAFMTLSGFSRHEILGRTTLGLNIWEHPEQRDVFLDLLRKNGACSHFEATFRMKNQKMLTGLMFARMIHFHGEPHIFSAVQDISERVAAREQIQYQIDLQHLLMDLSLLFLNVPMDFLDEALQEALARVGAFSKTDRVYIFSYDFQQQTMRNTYEWCPPGVEPEISNLQSVSFDEAPNQVNHHRSGEPFYIDDVSAMSEADPLRKHLADQGILSVLSVPLLDGQECIGFVGFDSVQRRREWSATEIKLFKVLAELLVNVIRRKRREEELKAARSEAERANIAKSRFLATMSHEIRTPMNGVVGMTELLLDTELNEEQSRYAQVIHSSGEALLGLINDILDFSKIEADKLELEVVPFSLPEVLDATVNMLAVTAQTKGLHLAWQKHDDVPIALVGDPLRLRQILLNLCGNAVKFTETGEVKIEVVVAEVHGSRFNGSTVGETTNGGVAVGRRNLTPGDIAPTAKPSDNNPEPTVNREPHMVHLRFNVHDTGPGIPADKLQLLFQCFQQVDASTTRQFGGTGLGLAISKRLAEMMDGQIGVESAEGRGSSFWFTARFAKQPGACASESPSQTMLREAHRPEQMEQLPQVRLGLRVLLVEDNPVNQLVTQKMLQKMGIFADTANNGQKAVAAVKKQVYDLVFMDIEMPIMDGLEATRKIRSQESEAGSQSSGPQVSGFNPQPPHRRTPIIALTAHAVHGDRERFLAAGFDDYLAKPLRFEALHETVIQWTKPANSPDESLSKTAPCIESGMKSTTETDTVCNKPELLGRVMGDHDLVHDVLRSLVDNGAARISAIKAHLARADARAVSNEAHGLKGAALNCSCPFLAETARKMEDAGRNNDLDALRALFPRLERDFEAVCDLVTRADEKAA
ncbi:PAS domain S-box-containing protein [Desulfonatronum zhilinae]|nr:PAS domain S-box-containing protein [Desulfonatronum zhilinae]